MKSRTGSESELSSSATVTLAEASVGFSLEVESFFAFTASSSVADDFGYMIPGQR